MAGSYTTDIPGNECLGDSRARINTNFTNLDNSLTNLSGSHLNLVTNVNTLAISVPDPNNIVTSIRAGDGILLNRVPGINATGEVTIDTYNSIEHINYGDFSPLPGTSVSPVANYPVDDGTTINFYRFPINTTTPPGLSFNSIALGTRAPKVSLYWTASAPATTTLFATNSAVSTRALGRTAPNNSVYTMELDGNTAYVGGSFTTIGGQNRRRFAIINLAGTPQTTTGPTGSLTTAGGSGSIGEIERLFLNSSGSAGFNGAIHCIKVATVGSKKYMFVGGSFTNAPAGDNTGTALGQRFAIFDITDGFNSTYTYTFNSTVYDLLVVGNYLYIAGAFTSGKRNNLNAANITMKGLTRIDLTGLEIDTTFTANTVSNTEGIRTSSHGIYTLEHLDGRLYTGGWHSARIGQGSATTHQYIMAHTLDGKVFGPWQPILNGGVTVLKVDTTRKTLYAGGQFTRYKTFTTSNIVRNYVAAFNLNTAVPQVYETWAPSFNSYVNCIDIHSENDITTPVYIGGQFNTINAKRCAHLVAVTRPETGNAGQQLVDWLPVINSSFLWYTQPGIIRIPSTSSLSGILLHGTFTQLNSLPRNYFGRMSGRGESVPPPLSSISWSVAGSVIGEGSQLSINTDAAVVVQDTPQGFGVINKTEITMTEAEFDGVSRGDICRYTIRRPSTTDTYRRDVWLIGASVDYNPSAVDEEPEGDTVI